MISLSYVRGTTQTPILFDSYTNLLLEFDKIEEDVRNAKYEYESAYADLLLNREFLEADSDEVKEKNGEVAEKKRNFVEKIGHGIKEIFRKAYEFIAKIVDKLKGEQFKTMNDLAKLGELKKKHPDLSDKIEIAFEEGKLSVKDAKSIAELEKEYLAIMKMSDPEQMNDRWLRAKQKFSDSADIIIKVGATAAAILSIATLGHKLQDISNSVKKSEEDMRRNDILNYHAATTVKSKDKNGDDIDGTEDISKNDGIWATKFKISKERTHLHVENSSRAKQLSLKIHSAIANTLDRWGHSEGGSDAAKDYHARMDREYAKIKARHDEMD